MNTIESSMHQNEQWLQEVFQQSPDAIVIQDLNGTMVNANEAFTRLSGMPLNDLTGKKIIDLLPADMREKWTHDIDKLIQGEWTRVQTLFFNAQDQRIPIDITLIAHTVCSGKNVVILHLSDISVYQTVERALVASQEEWGRTKEALTKSEAGLRQAAKMEAVGRLASGIAHDFNNMLSSISGYTSLLLQTMKPNDPMRDHVQEITRTVERASALTGQLMDINHDHPIETKVVNVNTVVKSMNKLLRTTLGVDIELETCLDKALWNVKADVSRLEQIIMNLAINARDAMPDHGQFNITTANTVLDKHFCDIHADCLPGNYVLLEVTDNGHGMPADVMEHIFEPFYTTKEKGIGLGLTTTYSIVRQFEGYVSCYSEVDTGTTFKIYLPKLTKA